jgi:hypothetical protein
MGSLAFVEPEMTGRGNRQLRDRSRQLKLRRRRASDRAARRPGDRLDQLEAGPRDAFVHDGPAVIDIVTARQKQLTFEQIKGFTFYASRTILPGRAVEIVEPAKTNLRDLGVE